MAKPMRVLICGVPNVGKSTLINALTNKRHAKTGDEAGITKLEQRITLADDFYLYDTPGLLWPRIIVAKSGYNLAASGAIGRNAYDEEEVALELLDYLRRHYAGLLEARFKLERRGRDEGRGRCSKPSAASAARCWARERSTPRRRPKSSSRNFAPPPWGASLWKHLMSLLSGWRRGSCWMRSGWRRRRRGRRAGGRIRRIQANDMLCPLDPEFPGGAGIGRSVLLAVEAHRNRHADSAAEIDSTANPSPGGANQVVTPQR